MMHMNNRRMFAVSDKALNDPEVDDSLRNVVEWTGKCLPHILENPERYHEAIVSIYVSTAHVTSFLALNFASKPEQVRNAMEKIEAAADIIDPSRSIDSSQAIVLKNHIQNHAKRIRKSYEVFLQQTEESGIDDTI